MEKEKERASRLLKLGEDTARLSEAQILWLEAIVSQFLNACEYWRSPSSDLITQKFLEDFGDTLKIHHCFSEEPFSKDKLEYAFQHVAGLSGFEAVLARKGNPGHDMTLNGMRLSLKTQADRHLRHEVIHISKFMELGKGKWGNDPKDLEGLRAQFLKHMEAYDRILVLRCIERGDQNWCYELVEVSKALLGEAQSGELEMRMDSSQMPRPGYCHVRAPSGELKFQLYFDGGSERKLQIKSLRTNLCILHARWRFSTHRFFPQQQTGFVFPPS